LTIKQLFLRIALPLFYGFLGGGVFHLLKLPAGFLSGGLIAMAAACLMGAKIDCPPRFKQFIFLSLGLILGSAVSPETVHRMGQWPLSLIGLTLMTYLITLSVAFYYERFAKWGKTTSFFAAVPGALSFVLALASTFEATNTRQVALSQSLRVVGLTVLLPIALALFGLQGQDIPPKPIISLYDTFILLLGTFVGGIIARFMRIPAGMLVGGMIGSALLYGAGIVKGEMPFFIQVACFLLLALMVSERFNGVTLQELKPLFSASSYGFMLSIALSALFAYGVSVVLKLPLGQVLLGFAPGGFEAMMLIAFVFDLDPAFVGAHHLFRFLLISLCLPFVVKWTLK
jgi:uncharacterized protein